MDLDDLAMSLGRLLRSMGAEDDVQVVREELAGVSRLTLTRKLPDHTRYARITPVGVPGAQWDFEVLGGRYGSSDPDDDFDGRRGGDGTYVERLVRIWLLELGSWNNVLPFESS